ncbi:protein expanded-like [Mercenaria mercenaria]|uniref:protein expanded-like n=1 Tax=Mercenaria mercenaria TaxID=6596 RepID=UPI001E1D39FB|nr:protein expanded-like [Mercenaria mercenaria]
MSTLSGSQTSGKKRKAVCVQLLNKEEYVCYVDVKSKFQDVFNQVATYLTLRETEYFGLAFKKEGEYHFVSNDDKVHKHTHKTWKTGPGDGFDGHGKPILTLYFRVQFYVDQVVLLREKVTRHLYYLQLKDNVFNYNHGCLEEKCFQIAGYALQADFGNYAAAVELDNYFDPREYFPAWMVDLHGQSYLVKNTPVVHRDLQSVSRSEAEWRFIKETSVPPSAHNLHFYRLRKKKTDKAWNAWLGICAKGIEIYEDLDDGFKDLISTFLWPDIGKLTFDKKKFEIRSVGTPSGRKFTYYTDSDVKSKYLLTLSRNTHMFQMAIQPKLMEIRHLEEEDKRRYRESYIHGEPRDVVSTPGSFRTNISPRSKTAMGNRYSVVSDTSSNTTSGIASDKMTVSFEENDDREIIIDTPPMPSGMLLNTPSQTRSKIVSTLPGYKPSPLPGANRSPVLDHSSQFNAYTFPSNRVQVHSPPYRLTNQNNVSSGSVQSDRSGSGQSEAYSVDSSSSGSYRKRYKQQQPQTGVYSPVVPLYSEIQVETGAREKTSQPTSRSASRKDSFKDILAELRAHQNLNINMLPPNQPHLVETPELKHVPSFHMEDLDYPHRSVSRSGSSDHRTNKSFESDLSAHSSQHTSMSTVTSHDYENVVLLSQESVASYRSSEGMLLDAIHIGGGERSLPDSSYHSSEGLVSDVSYHSDDRVLQEAEEILLPPMPFSDEQALKDIPVEQLPTDKQSELAVTQLPEHEAAHDAMDLKITDPEVQVGEGGVKKGKPTHIKVMNKKEVLHPEIEEIRGKSHAFSLPFITALCNDKTLQPIHSRSGSIAGSYDMSSIRSTDSRISRISHDTDVRRLSISGYPGSTSGTLVNNSFNSHRPFSWHSESFDLDAQLANLTAGNNSLSENHRSVPQNLTDFNSEASWTTAISYATPGGQSSERSPEVIASQLMIPSKLSSGGHNSTEANIRHKSLMNENIGIA